MQDQQIITEDQQYQIQDVRVMYQQRIIIIVQILQTKITLSKITDIHVQDGITVIRRTVQTIQVRWEEAAVASVAEVAAVHPEVAVEEDVIKQIDRYV